MSIAWVITLYFILLALSDASVTPFFEPPDESAHFLYTHNLLETGELPILESRDVVFARKATQRHHLSAYLNFSRWTQPADAPTGEYRLYVGWYDATSGERLPVTGEGGDIRDNLFFIPVGIVVIKVEGTMWLPPL